MPELPIELVNYISKYSYLIFIFVMLQGSLMVILFYIFAERLVTTKKVKLQNEIIKQEAYTKAVELLEEAKASSVKIVEEANKKAQLLLSDVQLLTDDVQKGLHEQLSDLSSKHVAALHTTSDTFIQDYKKALDLETGKVTESLEKTTTIVQDSLLAEVASFKEVLRNETYKSEEAVQLKIKDEYNAVRDEIEQYKKDKLSSIDDKIYEIISDVLNNTASKVLDLDSHQDIVIQFLEEAKKENRLY